MDARISTALPSHPKTKKLARRLGAAGPLACIYLFLWAAANRTDGDFTGMSDEDIELAVDWAGGEGVFIAAMVEAKFLDGEEGQRRIHDWAEHNPWAAGAEERSEAGKWGALCKRYGREGAAQRMPDYADRVRPASEPRADRTPPACESDAPSPSPSPRAKEPIPPEKIAPLSPKRAKRPEKFPLPHDFAISDRVREWAARKGYQNLDDHLEAFLRKAKANAYVYANWDDAFMEAIREDWAKLRVPHGTRSQNHRESVSDRVARLCAEQESAERASRGGDIFDGDFTAVG